MFERLRWHLNESPAGNWHPYVAVRPTGVPHGRSPGPLPEFITEPFFLNRDGHGLLSGWNVTLRVTNAGTSINRRKHRTKRGKL